MTQAAAQTVLIVGATSAIAVACARLWSGEGRSFVLVGRDGGKLAATAADLSARGAGKVETYVLDVNDTSRHDEMLRHAVAALGRVDTVLVAHGTLPDQQACEADADIAAREFAINAASTIALLTRIANQLAGQSAGILGVISSVAGDRGRSSNYLYGAAKAAVSTFCDGLRGRLLRTGVHVLLIKPGFVATPMTAGLPLPGPLVATPERVAADIVRAYARRADTLYTPWFWRLIMLVIRHIPMAIFKRLKF